MNMGKANLMKSFRAFLLFILVNALAGCNAAPTASTPISAQETTTPVPSRIPTLTATVPQPSVTAIPQATLTPTNDLPLTPTPFLLPTLPQIGSTSIIQLVQPAPEELIETINLANNQIWYSQGNRQYEEVAAKRTTFFDVVKIVDREIEQYFPDGLPEPEIIFENYQSTDYFNQIIPDVYVNLIPDAILAQLNNEKIILTDQMLITNSIYEVEVHQVELDHDSRLEWLLKIVMNGEIGLTWLALDEGEDRVYINLTTELPEYNGVSYEVGDTELILQDFTGDGLTDGIFIYFGYMMGTYYTDYYIVQGGNDGFHSISQINQYVFSYLSKVKNYSVESPDDSWQLTLTLTQPNDINWGCGWDTLTTYSWPNGIERISVEAEQPPNTPECMLARAVYVGEEEDNQTSIRLLEDAISGFDEGDPDDAGKIQFAHYRLAVLYALEGDDAQAREYLEWFIDSYTQSNEFLEKNLAPLLEDEKINPINVCSVMASAAYAVQPAEWWNYVNAASAIHAFPGSDEPYSPAICPLTDILMETLDSVQFDPTHSPQAALEASGITVKAMHEYLLPNYAHPAWFAILDSSAQYSFGYLPDESNRWEWQLLSSYHPSFGEVNTHYGDVTGDGHPELAFTIDFADLIICNRGEHPYQLVVITATAIGLVSTGELVCGPSGEPFDIAANLADTDGDGYVDWVIDQVNQYASNYEMSAEQFEPVTWFTPSEIIDWIDDLPDEQEVEESLDQLIFTTDDLDFIRQQIIDRRANLDPDDVATPYEWQHLTYLMAKSYELEGRTEEAIDSYLSIIQAEPHTIWGNLAALHLEVQE